MANMPSGRDIHSTKRYVPPSLDEDILAHMRAPPDNTHFENAMDNDSSDDSGQEGKRQSEPPGAFPGSSAVGSNSNAYY